MTNHALAFPYNISHMPNAICHFYVPYVLKSFTHGTLQCQCQVPYIKVQKIDISMTDDT